MGEADDLASSKGRGRGRGTRSCKTPSLRWSILKDETSRDLCAKTDAFETEALYVLHFTHHSHTNTIGHVVLHFDVWCSMDVRELTLGACRCRQTVVLQQKPTNLAAAEDVERSIPTHLATGYTHLATGERLPSPINPVLLAHFSSWSGFRPAKGLCPERQYRSDCIYLACALSCHVSVVSPPKHALSGAGNDGVMAMALSLPRHLDGMLKRSLEQSGAECRSNQCPWQHSGRPIALEPKDAMV